MHHVVWRAAGGGRRRVWRVGRFSLFTLFFAAERAPPPRPRPRRRRATLLTYSYEYLTAARPDTGRGQGKIRTCISKYALQKWQLWCPQPQTDGLWVLSVAL
eukprot:scaffold1446_cov145-Skeletonema_menzelii.AAC.21